MLEGPWSLLCLEVSPWEDRWSRFVTPQAIVRTIETYAKSVSVLEKNILARLGTAHLLEISGPAGDSGFPEFSASGTFRDFW
jgi:hypothetical protein